MTDRELIQITTGALADSARRAGHHLACHSGCHQCCIGIFPISQLDAVRLRNGLNQAPHEIAERILQRAQASRNRLAPDFPGDSSSGILNLDDPAFEDFANDEPCPVLDPSTGTCDLYDARPMTCRTFGPPIRNEEEGLAVCELCFTTAMPEEIEAAEVDASFLDLEEELNQQIEDENQLKGPTLIAWALKT